MAETIIWKGESGTEYKYYSGSYGLYSSRNNTDVEGSVLKDYYNRIIKDYPLIKYLSISKQMGGNNAFT